MSRLIAGSWHRLKVNPAELRVTDTLQNGQCFGWVPVEAGGPAADTDDDISSPELVGVLGECVIGLRDISDDVCFRCYNAPRKGNTAKLRAALVDYFQLGTKLVPLQTAWAAGDSRLASITPCIPGLRVLRQDPTECLFSFLCSSNNNISRITQMLGRLRSKYGTPLGVVSGLPMFTFPTLDTLAAVDEAELRALGFGYRAPFVVKSAQRIKALGGSAWLESLRSMDTEAARTELCSLHGVGRKVADCVAVFSLDSPECVPCDTHVWRIACRDMDPTLIHVKSLTPAVHTRVNELFVQRFGVYAGWAHSLLFAAELPQFSSRLPKPLRDEMEAFRDEGRRAKAERKRGAPKAPTSNARAKKSREQVANLKRS